MATKYKIWTYIEEINEDEGHYEDVGCPMSVFTPNDVNEFGTLEEAEEYRHVICYNPIPSFPIKGR